MAPIKSLVRSHVEEAVLLSNVGAEVSFQLPNDASPSFQAMLAEIDARKTELGINRYVLRRQFLHRMPAPVWVGVGCGLSSSAAGVKTPAVRCVGAG